MLQMAGRPCTCGLITASGSSPTTARSKEYYLSERVPIMGDETLIRLFVRRRRNFEESGFNVFVAPVSYTHLDVYKRQLYVISMVYK